MSKHLAKTKAMSFTSDGLLEVPDAAGIKALHGRKADVVLQRPDRFYASALDDDGVRSEVWFDGKTFTLLYSAQAGTRYASVEAPEGARSIDGIQDYMTEKYGFVLQIGDLFYSDVWGMSKDALLSARYLGPKLVPRPLLPSRLARVRRRGGSAGLGGRTATRRSRCRWGLHPPGTSPRRPLYVTEFDSWVDDPGVDAARFRFAPPDGAKKLEMNELKSWANAQ